MGCHKALPCPQRYWCWFRLGWCKLGFAEPFAWMCLSSSSSFAEKLLWLLHLVGYCFGEGVYLSFLFVCSCEYRTEKIFWMLHVSKATQCLAAVGMWTGMNILERSTLSFEMLKVCLHGRWGRGYSSPVWMSLSTRLPRMNNDGFVVTLTKKQFAYPTQPTQSKRTRMLCLPSQGCFIRAHSHVPASVLSWPYSAFFFYPFKEVVCPQGGFCHLENS